MNLLKLLLPTVVLCLCSAELVLESRIVGGRRVRDVPEIPYQVGFFTIDGIHCGGALITPDTVITAAHCFDPEHEILSDAMIVVLGKSNLKKQESKTEIFTQISSIHLHPEYDPLLLTYDIAIVKLTQPVCLNNGIQLISLPVNSNIWTMTALILFSNRKEFHSGWGYTKKRIPHEFNSRIYYSMLLKVGNIRLIEKNICQTQLRKNVGLTSANVINHSSIFCGGIPSGQEDNCQGDSGGPAVCKISADGGITHNLYLCGVVSAGLGCGQVLTPAFYTNVTEMLGWINEVLTKKCSPPETREKRYVSGTLKLTHLPHLPRSHSSSSKSVLGRIISIALALLFLFN